MSGGGIDLVPSRCPVGEGRTEVGEDPRALLIAGSAVACEGGCGRETTGRYGNRLGVSGGRRRGGGRWTRAGPVPWPGSPGCGVFSCHGGQFVGEGC